MARRLLAGGLQLALLVGALASWVPPAEALTQVPSAPWGVRGKIIAMTERVGGTRVYVGGSFGQLRSNSTTSTAVASSVAAFTISTGAPIPNATWPRPMVTYQGGPGTVKALALDSTRGVLYIGGQFDAVNGVAVSNLAAVS